MKKQMLKTEKGKGLERMLDEVEVKKLQDIYNPMKFFHRLKRVGFETETALHISQHYENLFYSTFIKIYFEKDSVAEVQRETLSYSEYFG